MKLFVARHHYAGPSSSDPAKERARPLTDEGAASAKRVAQELVDMDECPSVIFCSPLTRTTQTADIYGKTMGVQVDALGDLAPHRPLAAAILGLIGGTGPEVKRLMIVCHADNTLPAFSYLSDGDEWSDLVMGEVRKLKIDRETGAWKQLWSLKPSDLGLKDYK